MYFLCGAIGQHGQGGGAADLLVALKIDFAVARHGKPGGFGGALCAGDGISRRGGRGALG